MQKKRPSIGSAQNTDAFYWSAGLGTYQQRQNERECFSWIDYYQSFCTLDETTAAQKEDYYSEMDKFFCIFKLIQKFGATPELLQKSGIVMCDAVQSGAFSKKFYSLDERNEYIDRLIISLIDKTPNITRTEQKNNSFLDYWASEVMLKNYYILPNGTKSANAPEVSTIGVTDDELMSDFKKGALTYIYSVVPASSFPTGCAALKKRMCQLASRNALAVGCSQLSGDIQARQIIAASNEQTGRTPSNFVEQMKRETAPQIGEPATITAIISLIATVISGIAAVVVAYVNMQAVRENARATLSTDYLNMNRAMSGDMYNGDPSTLTASNYSKNKTALYLLAGLMAAGAIILI